LRGGEIDAGTAYKMLLYSYCKTFSINPMEARHTEIQLMLEMLSIHGEVEQYKTDEMEKKLKR